MCSRQICCNRLMLSFMDQNLREMFPGLVEMAVVSTCTNSSFVGEIPAFFKPISSFWKNSDCVPVYPEGHKLK